MHDESPASPASLAASLSRALPRGLPARLLSSVACSLLSLAACAPLPEVTDVRQVSVPVPVPVRVPVPVPEPSEEATRRIATLAERVRTLPANEVAPAIAALGQPQQTEQILELALLLAQTRVLPDLVKGIALLEGITRSQAPEVQPWQPVARVLLSRYLEQRRVEEQLDRQNQSMREQQRKLDQLNEKLEALKAIERSLAPRPTPPGSPPASAPGSPPPPASSQNGAAAPASTPGSSPTAAR